MFCASKAIPPSKVSKTRSLCWQTSVFYVTRLHNTAFQCSSTLSEVSNTTPFPSNKLNDDGSLQGLSFTRVQILWTMRLWVSVTAWSERRTSLIDYSGAFTSWIHSFKQLSSLIRAIQTHSNHYYGRVTRIPVTQIHTNGHQTEAGLITG